MFFRNQNIDLENQKKLTQKLGELAGKPETSKLHVQPLFNSPDNTPLNDKGDADLNGELDVCDSPPSAEISCQFMLSPQEPRRNCTSPWNTECRHLQHRCIGIASTSSHIYDRLVIHMTHNNNSISFETVPADYSFLKLTETPTTGGDTVRTTTSGTSTSKHIPQSKFQLWASGYEVYDRLSPPMRELFSRLTATFAQPVFKRAADEGGFAIPSPRGSPQNVGDAFEVSHPVVRTNPVTGWRSVFALGLHCREIDDVTPHEKKLIKEYIEHLVAQCVSIYTVLFASLKTDPLRSNHDLQVRFRWNPNDVAIWDK